MSSRSKKNKKKSSGKGGLIIGSCLRSVVLFLGFFFKVIFKVLKFFGLWIPLLYALFGFILYKTLDFNPFLFDLYGTLYLCGALACVVATAIISIRNVVIRPARSIYHGYKHPFWEKKKEEKEARDAELERNIEKLETIKQRKRDEKYTPPLIDEFVPEKKTDIGDYLLPIEDFAASTKAQREEKKYSLNFDWLPQLDSGNVGTDGVSTPEVEVKSFPKGEKPDIYFSELEPDLLVHEYSDRFELFRVSDGKRVSVGVKYK